MKPYKKIFLGLSPCIKKSGVAQMNASKIQLKNLEKQKQLSLNPVYRKK